MTEPLVRKVDHVFVPVKDPEPLFTLFTETIGLPVAWPLDDHGIFRSAGVCLGNANLEFVTGDATIFPFFVPTEPLTPRGVAFEPASDDPIPELAARDLRHSDAAPFHEDGRLLWTNVFLAGMTAGDTIAFLCRYHEAPRLRGDEARAAVLASGGGAIGVRGLAEITLGIRDLAMFEPRWRRLLSPVEPDDHGAFHLAEGPTIRLRRSPIDGVAALWLEVASLAHARDALRERDLLGPMRASGIGLNYARTGGLDVWLTEGR